MRFGEFLVDQRIVKPATFIDKPCVSVIMPTYRRAKDGLLARAITSVLSQTFSDFEFIIVDDGSTDGSEEIIREFQKQDGRMLYVRHEVNSGLPGLRVDEAILLSRGDYIAFEFDDDEWLPPFLQTLTREAIEQNRSFVHCQAEYLVGERVYVPRFPVTQPTYASLLQRNKLANCSTLVRKSVFEKSGLYDPHVIVRRFTDWDLWIRISQFEPPLLVPETLVRVHAGLSDSIGERVRTVEYEDYWLMLQAPRIGELGPQSIMDYDVMSLDRYVGRLSPQAIESLHNHNVVPWFNDHREQFQRLGVCEELLTIAVPTTESDPGSGPSPLPTSASPSVITRIKGRFMPRLMRKILGRIMTTALPVLQFLKMRFVGQYDKSDCWDAIPDSLAILKDDARTVNWRRKGYLLQLSPDLRSIPYLTYGVTVDRDYTSGVILSAVADNTLTKGSIEITLVPSESKGAKRSSTSATARTLAIGLCGRVLLTFYLEPPIEAGEYDLFVKGWQLGEPVHVLELKKIWLSKPFCHFVVA